MKDVEGYEGRYSITPDGRVWSHARETNKNYKGKWLSPAQNRSGYLHIGFWLNGKGKWFDVHRLVAKAYIPNPDGKREVNHINGDKTDNRVENLEWTTRLENHRHAILTGLSNSRGESHPNAKLTEADVIAIRASSDTQVSLSKKYGIAESTISLILKRKNWKHI